MERASSNRGLVNEEGVIIGVAFGSTACDEHESGHDSIKHAFGIQLRATRESFGFDARTITVIPAELRFLQFGHTTYLIYHPNLSCWSDDRFVPEHLDRLVMARVGDDISTVWDESGFGIRITRDDSGVLKRISDAMKTNDVVIFQAGGAWLGAGLHICIKSLIPDNLNHIIAEGDLSRLDLNDAFSATGIEQRLKTAGKKYIALSPRWVNRQDGTFKVWLNPDDQRNNNYGWFTIADLDAWINGEGPIPKIPVVA